MPLVRGPAPCLLSAPTHPNDRFESEEHACAAAPAPFPEDGSGWRGRREGGEGPRLIFPVTAHLAFERASWQQLAVFTSPSLGGGKRLSGIGLLGGHLLTGSLGGLLATAARHTVGAQ